MCNVIGRSRYNDAAKPLSSSGFKYMEFFHFSRHFIATLCLTPNGLCVALVNANIILFVKVDFTIIMLQIIQLELLAFFFLLVFLEIRWFPFPPTRRARTTSAIKLIFSLPFFRLHSAKYEMLNQHKPNRDKENDEREEEGKKEVVVFHTTSVSHSRREISTGSGANLRKKSFECECFFIWGL